MPLYMTVTVDAVLRALRVPKELQSISRVRVYSRLLYRSENGEIEYSEVKGTSRLFT